jgi:GNAT superfamily N-acetyltransferase
MRAHARRRSVEAPHGPAATTNRYCSPRLGNRWPAAQWLRYCGGSLAGFAVASWLQQETVAEVEGLVVDRTIAGRALGSALIGACMAWAANAGASSIRLEVRASNAAALRSIAATASLPWGAAAPITLLRRRRCAAAG